MRKQISILIANIKNLFDVRKKLDDDHVMFLGSLIEGGEVLTPIEVVQIGPNDYAYIDGRHRGAAYDLMGHTKIEAYVTPYQEEDKLVYYAKAMKANWGGSKPPTKGDIEFTILQVMNNGVNSIKQVKELFPYIPATVVRRYMTDATSTMRKKRIAGALADISNGAKLDEAAQKHKVDPEIIRQTITGKRTRIKGDKLILAEFKKGISRSLRTANSTIASKFNSLLDCLEGGEVLGDTCYKCVDAWEEHLNTSVKRMKEWRERIKQREVG
jgi:hypothetical protein